MTHRAAMIFSRVSMGRREGQSYSASREYDKAEGRSFAQPATAAPAIGINQQRPLPLSSRIMHGPRKGGSSSAMKLVISNTTSQIAGPSSPWWSWPELLTPASMLAGDPLVDLGASKSPLRADLECHDLALLEQPIDRPDMAPKVSRDAGGRQKLRQPYQRWPFDATAFV